MAINPIVYTEKVIRSFLKYQLSACAVVPETEGGSALRRTRVATSTEQRQQQTFAPYCFFSFVNRAACVTSVSEIRFTASGSRSHFGPAELPLPTTCFLKESIS